MKALIYGTNSIHQEIEKEVQAHYSVVGYLSDELTQTNIKKDYIPVYHTREAKELDADIIVVTHDEYISAIRHLLSLEVYKPTIPWMSFKSGKTIKTSETCLVRGGLVHYCVGEGVDIGYGGDPICETAICVDLEKRYARYASFQNYPQHLYGDATSLYWFSDNSLDYVYSSHVLEDFEDTKSVFTEWLRVLKPGGKMVLYLPDEQAYRKWCRDKGLKSNINHIHLNFSLNYMKNILTNFENVEIIHERFPCETESGKEYSFELVIKKTHIVDYEIVNDDVVRANGQIRELKCLVNKQQRQSELYLEKFNEQQRQSELYFEKFSEQQAQICELKYLMDERQKQSMLYFEKFSGQTALRISELRDFTDEQEEQIKKLFGLVRISNILYRFLRLPIQVLRKRND